MPLRVLRRRELGFLGFEEWREETWETEDEARHKLDRKINVTLDKVSVSVKEAIVAAGGTVIETQPAPAAGE